MSKTEEYPEHAKLKTISKESQTCGEFIDWLQERGYNITTRKRGEVFNLRRALAEFFEIDEKKLEDEKRAMLDSLARNQ